MRVARCVIAMAGYLLVVFPAGAGAGTGSTHRIDLAQPLVVSAASLDPHFPSADGGATAGIPGAVFPQVDISADGRYVVYVKDGTIFMQDRTKAVPALVTKDASGNKIAATSPRISADGRRVAFVTQAQLEEGDLTSSMPEIYVKDLVSDSYKRASRSGEGPVNDGRPQAFEPDISASGRFIAFTSYARDLVQGEENDCVKPPVILVQHCPDVFVYDMDTGVTERVSKGLPQLGGNVGPSEQGLVVHSSQPSISPDGRFVAYRAQIGYTHGTGLTAVSKILVRDRVGQTTEEVSLTSDGRPAAGPLAWPSISGDGRYIAYASLAPNLVSGDDNNKWDIFLYDRETDQVRRVSEGPGGVDATAHSGWPTISADGGSISFTSWSSGLVTGDTNNYPDVFVWDRASSSLERISVSSEGAQGNVGSGMSAMSAAGSIVAFLSEADNLTPDNPDVRPDLYVRQRSG